MQRTVAKSRACPDCPSMRTGLLDQLARSDAGCQFRCVTVRARDELPIAWRGTYGLALVRRGIVVRQRVDAEGRGTSIDIVGPGKSFPIAAGEGGTLGYAVDDAMLCLLPSRLLDEVVDGGARGARAVMEAQTATLARVEQIAVARARTTAASRVASLVLTLEGTLADRRLDMLPAAIQQRDLAALVGLRHESVCRIIASFVRAGLLGRSPHGLSIVDRAALERT